MKAWVDRVEARLREVDWHAVGQWIGGVILILALLGFLLGGSDSPGWWGGFAE